MIKEVMRSRFLGLVVAVTLFAGGGTSAHAETYLFLKSKKNYEQILAVDQQSVVRSGNTLRFVAFSKSEWKDKVYSIIAGETDCTRSGAMDRELSRIDVERSGMELREVSRSASTSSRSSSLGSAVSPVAFQLCNLKDEDVIDRLETSRDVIVTFKMDTVHARAFGAGR